MILTTEERLRFAQYLEIDADSSDQMAAQMDKLPSPAIAELAKRQRIEATAARIVAKKLRSMSTETIGR